MILCRQAHESFNIILRQFPGNCLEIGVFEGDSIAQLARNHPNKTVYGIDPFVEDSYTQQLTKTKTGETIYVQRDIAYANIRGLENAKIFEERSEVFARRPDEFLRSLDVSWVLIDGSHRKSDVLIDSEIAMRLIGEKFGGIIFDDCSIPEVREAYLEWLHKYQSKLQPAFDLLPVLPNHIIFHTVNLKCLATS